MRFTLPTCALVAAIVSFAVGEALDAATEARARGEALFLLARSFRDKGIPDLAEKGLHAALEAAGTHRQQDLHAKLDHALSLLDA